MTMLRNFLSILAMLMLAACGGGGNSGTAPFGAGGASAPGTGTATVADLVITLDQPTIPNAGTTTANATVVALDANRNAVSGVAVTLSANAGAVLTVAGSAGSVTDASGRIVAAVGRGADDTPRDITITAASSGITRTVTLRVVAGSSSAPSLTVSLSSNTVTSAAPATVTSTLRDASGAAVANAVVSFSTGRGNLATLGAASALTNAQGIASVTLSSAASGVQGADQVIATATVAGTALTANAGFAVTAQTPTIAISPSSSSLSFTSAPLTLTARVLDAAGNAVANQIVRFAATNGLVGLNVASALTNAAGNASVLVQPLAASNSGAEIVTASTTVAGRDLQALASVQLVPQAPSVSTTVAPSSSVTATTPATLRAVVRDLNNNLLPNTVVTFTSQSRLVSFTPATRVTDANGEATTVVSPASSTANGADTVTANVTVQGLTAVSNTVVQVLTSAPTGTPTLGLTLTTSPATSPISISAAGPATVTATLRDAQGNGVASQVISFRVVRGLAVTNIVTALTNASGNAVVVLSPATSAAAGADEISASATYAGVTLQQTQGFQVQATPVTLGALTALANPLSAYGQTTLTLPLTGASVTSPVNISFTSACAALGKATLSPSSITATSSPVTVQYKDNGCGAVQSSDQIQAVVTATGASSSLALNIQSPASSSIAFVRALPEQIFLRGSGFVESSVITFQVNDAAGNPLPNNAVELRLQTGAGGVTMEGRGVESVSPASANPFTATSNALGQVSVRVNSGTLPTPVRVNARLVSNTAIATVSSNLSVAVGLPSQLNFSFSQGTKNIEGYNIDGTINTYQIIAADRSGNPVPAGTSINFVTEGGQIEAVKQTQLVNGIARTTANFVSSEPRPVDGRVTVTVYALGEESFLDANGNNAYDLGEPFQDLGNVFRDRNFDGNYDVGVDEFVPLTINNGSACAAVTNNLLRLDASIPSMPLTCDGNWSGAGQVYVRRATETVLSTSAARPLWANTSGLTNQCRKLTLQTGPLPSTTAVFTLAGGDTWYGPAADVLNFIVADANPGSDSQGLRPRLNPMAAGTQISATTPTSGLSVIVGGGAPVPSTTEASLASVAYNFTDPLVTSGVVFINFTSPSGLTTTISVTVLKGATQPSTCPP